MFVREYEFCGLIDAANAGLDVTPMLNSFRKALLQAINISIKNPIIIATWKY